MNNPHFFPYDTMIKFGEFDESWGWFHDELFNTHYVPRFNSTPNWMCFNGEWGGDYWSVNTGIPLVGIIETRPPKTPSLNRFWTYFPIDYDEFHTTYMNQTLLWFTFLNFEWDVDPPDGDTPPPGSPYIGTLQLKTGSQCSIGLEWPKEENALRYDVYRYYDTGHPDGHNFVKIAETSDTTYTDANVTVPNYESDYKLAYFVKMVDAGNSEHEPSETVRARVPIAPLNLAGTAASPNYHPVLIWRKSHEFDVASYRVYKMLMLSDSTIMPFTSVTEITDTTWADTTFAAYHGGPETAYYYVTAVNINNCESVTSDTIDGEGRSVAGNGSLVSSTIDSDAKWYFSASPNPFNYEISFKFQIPLGGYVDILLYDIQGKKVVDLFHGYANAGKNYNVIFNGEKHASGVYLCVMNAPGHNETKKVILLK